jgi:hypothetical protein
LPYITNIHKQKKVVDFEYLSKDASTSQFLAIANKRIDDSDTDVSLGESLVIPLFINSKGVSVQGTETSIPNYL